MMMRVLIADDEDLARASVRRTLESLGDVEVVGEARNGVEALEVISQATPDVVLLDIEMPGLDGFEVARQMPPGPSIVFVTAFDEYAVRAFEANAIDYVMKPVQPERLALALKRARERAGTDSARKVAHEQAGPVRRLAARRGKRIVIVSVNEIIRVEIEDKLVFAVTASEKVLVEKTIAELETMLEPSGFLRISRGELVNLESVKELVPWFSGTWRVKLANGEERDVSRERAKDLKAAMGLD